MTTGSNQPQLSPSGPHLWAQATGVDTTSWGVIETEKLAEYLTTSNAAPVTWQSMAAIDGLLDAMSFYSAYHVPLLRVAIDIAERLGDPERAGLMLKHLRLADVLRERRDASADIAASLAVAIAEGTRAGPELAGVLRQAAECVSPLLAVDYLTRALDILQKCLPPNSEQMLSLNAALAQRLIQVDRAEEGRSRCLSHISFQVNAFGPESAEAADALDWTARVLVDLPDSIDFARQALALRECLGEQAAIARSLVTIATILDRGENFVEAEQRLGRAVAIIETLPAPQDDLASLRQYLVRLGLARLRAEAYDREWDHAVCLAEKMLGADAPPFDLAVASLLQARPIFSWPLDYTLSCEAAVLLASAGRIDEALALVHTDLAETPARWDAAAVHAAIADRLIRAGDTAGAANAVRQATATALAIKRIYEREDPYPAVRDLLDALAMAGRISLTEVVAAALSGDACDVFADWQNETDVPTPSDADDRVALAAGEGNAYVAIGSMIATARAAADCESRDVALRRGLDLLINYTGEEAYRSLIYHEDYRFTAAHGLGSAVRKLLEPEAREAFARNAIHRSRQLSDAFAGASVLVAAGEASLGGGK